MTMLRVVLDTNVLLSGIAYPSSIPGKILTAWRRGGLDVVLSAYILDELRRVLPRLAHRHGLSEADIHDLVDSLSILCEVIDPEEPGPTVLRDGNDLPVLGTLRAALKTGGAGCLVTGDKDLLTLASSHPILSPAEFWAAHGDIEPG
ncbi:MAG: putative toxin-antitoxin system toxin component, PIN family [Pseudomonadota bacterium]